MLEAIEKLIILQDRDRKLIRLREELAHIPAERLQLQAKSSSAQTNLDTAKQKGKQIESDRKKLELDVDAKKQQIEKYSLQQFQTKKNEEYRALNNEIENCKKAIVQIEDQELELMEQAEAVQKQILAAQQLAADAKKLVDGKLVELDTREKNLRAELASLESNRAELANAVDDEALGKYERL